MPGTQLDAETKQALTKVLDHYDACVVSRVRTRASTMEETHEEYERVKRVLRLGRAIVDGRTDA